MKKKDKILIFLSILAGITSTINAVCVLWKNTGALLAVVTLPYHLIEPLILLVIAFRLPLYKHKEATLGLLMLNLFLCLCMLQELFYAGCCF